MGDDKNMNWKASGLRSAGLFLLFQDDGTLEPDSAVLGVCFGGVRWMVRGRGISWFCWPSSLGADSIATASSTYTSLYAQHTLTKKLNGTPPTPPNKDQNGEGQDGARPLPV